MGSSNLKIENQKDRNIDQPLFIGVQVFGK
jgi:hypothetical protein